MSASTAAIDFLVGAVIPTATGQLLQATAATGAAGTAAWTSGSAAHETPLTVGGTGVVFKNSWVNFGAPNESASYYKDPLGVVRLRGIVKSGTINTAMFTLPAGYRPSNTRHFAVVSNGAFGDVYVDSSGNVICSVGSNTWVSLDSVTFDVP
jgi:hypothetical protein